MTLWRRLFFGAPFGTVVVNATFFRSSTSRFLSVESVTSYHCSAAHICTTVVDTLIFILAFSLIGVRLGAPVKGVSPADLASFKTACIVILIRTCCNTWINCTCVSTLDKKTSILSAILPCRISDITTRCGNEINAYFVFVYLTFQGLHTYLFANLLISRWIKSITF